MPIKYSNSNYTFTSPVHTHKGRRRGLRRYIKYLEQIAKCNANGFNPTRKQVQVALGDPDPTKPNDWWRKLIARCMWMGGEVPTDWKRGSNWGISRWTAMKQAGLIHSERNGNAVHYQITTNGLLLLHSVL